MKTFYTVHAIAQNENGEILVLQRANHRSSPGLWLCITGYVQERESAEDAALRELKEETNLNGQYIRSTEPFWKSEEETTFVVVASLIKVTDVHNFIMNKSESQAYKWVPLNDPLIQSTEALKIGLEKLGLI